MISEMTTNDVVRTGQRTDNIADVREVSMLESTRVHEIRLRHLRGPAAPPILATAEHLFWVDGKGWTTVGQLKPGDWLSNTNGIPLEIVENRMLDRQIKVYTLRLDRDNAFYANDVLVHDLCGGLLPVTPVTTTEVSK